MGRVDQFSGIMDHELSMLWQAIFTYASWAIAAAMLVVAIQMGRKQNTAFYAFAVLAVGLGAFAEPMYDVAFDLWFYDVHDGKSGAMWSHFTAFGVIQPIWSHSGYIILYGAIALYAGRKLYQGNITRRGLFAIWGLEIATSCAFEMIAINTDMYQYYGPHELRVFNYPLVIGTLEGTQTLIFTLVAVQIWRRAKDWKGLTSLFLVFPMTMMGVNLGLGMPVIIALHLKPGEFSSELVLAASLFVIATCALMVNALIHIVPKPLGTAEPDGAPAPRLRTTPEPVSDRSVLAL
jgi:hypothetical protein